jgi:hypothetical protein
MEPLLGARSLRVVGGEQSPVVVSSAQGFSPVPTSTFFLFHTYLLHLLLVHHFPLRNDGYEGDEMGGGMFHIHMKVEVVPKRSVSFVILIFC